MKLEQQVVSLEIAKRLKELGVEQESYLLWAMTEFGNWLVMNHHQAENYKQRFPAYTVAELGEMLPDKFDGYMFGYNPSIKKWWVQPPYENPEDKENDIIINADTEADARGKMLIYLIDNGLLKGKSNGEA